ncbi:GDSL-type esterase/lipase family protein [Rhodocytophaga aerolata]|uniref:GDSL-type esterase/lipase family protein n=1 Tax=Rhodocytophaga aerolata TaxID=455078 RepID=A0ABT8RDK5_9BACT|nr:GDSL-type esterase/lipase family protein [Rhodocytophaga aerolata]MDO1449318.1 GDSL-type esterase/lipase family protein [Rhodocytophaga aerolata]
MKKIAITLGYIVLLFFDLPYKSALTQPVSRVSSQAPTTPFELTTNDRVVFLGNSLFENDLQYGYLELVLTTRWPDRNITFRNLGWSGDTVWGDARKYISPPSGYHLLLEQLTKAQPTVVIIGYGAIESEEGEQGIAHFSEGLNKLIDKIDQLGARTILLSPQPVMPTASGQDLGSRNVILEMYTSAIAKTATDRGKPFIDIFHPLLEQSKTVALSDNGFHLNENGYYYLAATIEKELGLVSPNASVYLDASRKTVEGKLKSKVLEWNKNNDHIQFSIDENYLPLPLPQPVDIPKANTQTVTVKGLKKGIYTLSIDNSQAATASASQWAAGVEIKQGTAFDQAKQLQELIVKKNELFFHQYRPQNKTYILGFRSHEQGRHTKGLEELQILITWLEGQIAIKRMPKTSVYELTRVN